MSEQVKTPAWEVMMSVIRPGLDRARFFSIHTIAIVLGEKDPKKLLERMKEGGRVVGCMCPVVEAPVFFLRDRWGSHYWHNDGIWDLALDYIASHPYPKIKGFKSRNAHWTGGRWGAGEYVSENNAMEEPFIKDDYAYANMIIEALKKAGYEPHITPYTEV